MNTPRPLPLGVEEFEKWTDRIISGVCIPGVTPRSLKFAMAEMVLHLKPTEDHVADGYFIKSLRKAAANQVCHAMFVKLKQEQQAEEEAKKPKVVPVEALA